MISLRKISFLSLLILAFFVPLKSQTQSFTKGIVVGVNYSGWTSKRSGWQLRKGLSLGVFSTFRINDRLDFQPELLFDQMGYIFKQRCCEPFINIRANYIRIPLLANVKLPVRLWKETQAISIQLGVSPAVLLNAEDKLNEDFFIPGEPNIRDDYLKYDLLCVLGLNVRLTQNLSFTGRYSQGLYNVFKHISPEFPEFNRNIHLSLRWRFVPAS